MLPPSTPSAGLLRAQSTPSSGLPLSTPSAMLGPRTPSGMPPPSTPSAGLLRAQSPLAPLTPSSVATVALLTKRGLEPDAIAGILGIEKGAVRNTREQLLDG